MSPTRQKIEEAKEEARKKSEEKKRYLDKKIKNITGEEVKTSEIKEENILKNPEPMMVKKAETANLNPKKLDKAITEVRERKEEITEKEVEQICEKHGINPERAFKVPSKALGIKTEGRKWANFSAKEFLEKMKERKPEIGGYTEGDKYIYINPERSEKTKKIAKKHEGIHQSLEKLKKKGKIEKRLPMEVDEAVTTYLTSLDRIKSGGKKEEILEELEERIKLPQGPENRRGMEVAKKLLEDYKPKEAEQTLRRILNGEGEDISRRFERVIDKKELVKKKRQIKQREKKEENKGILEKITDFLFG